MKYQDIYQEASCFTLPYFYRLGINVAFILILKFKANESIWIEWLSVEVMESEWIKGKRLKEAFHSLTNALLINDEIIWVIYCP